MGIAPTHLDTMQKLMDAALLRQQAIAQNIANVNTPGYRSQEVNFESQLAEAMQTGAPPNWAKLRPELHEAEGLPVRADGNNVDVDRELGALSKNSVMFQLYSQILSSKIRAMHAAIRGQS